MKSLGDSIGGLSAQFDGLQKAMAAQEKLASRVKAGESSLAKAQSDRLSSSDAKWTADRKKADDATAAMRAQQDKANGMAKEFSALTASGDKTAETFAALKEEFGLAAQAATAALAVIVALAAGIAHLMAVAIALSQQKDALRETFGVLTGGGAEGGSKLLDELEDLSQTLPFTADKLNEWAKSMLAAGIQGDDLKTSIKAVAAATAIMGESGGQAAMGLIKRFAMMAEAGQKVKLDRRILNQFAEAGISVQALAKALGVAPEKLGQMQIGAKELGAAMQKALIQQGEGPLKQLGNTWESITAKLKEGWEDLWEDLGPVVEPFMAAVRSLAEEFFAGSTAGGQAKDVIKAAFTEIFQAATKAVNAIHIGFLYAEIAVLRFRIAIKPVTDWLEESGAAAFALKWGWTALAVIGGLLAVIFGILAVAVFMVLLPFLLVIAAVFLIVFAFYKLGSAIFEASASVKTNAGDILTTIKNTAADIWDFLSDLPIKAAEGGGNFVLGLIQAITTGQGPVAEAVKALARSAIAAITNAFIVKSPSRVMMKIGGHVATGLAMGIEAGAGEVADAARGTAEAGIDGAAGAPGKATGGRGGNTYNITLNVDGGGQTWQEVTREALAIVLEEAADQAGV